MSAVTEQPPATESRATLSAGELARLQRAALLFAALFVGATFGFATIASATGNALFIGIGGLFAWCGIVATVQYLFLRFAAKDRAEAEYARALEARAQSGTGPGRSDPAVRRAPFLPEFAKLWQWAVLAAGLVAALVIFP